VKKREENSPSRDRLLGWLRRRIASARRRIWLEVDIVEFCEVCGLSERTGRYALERLRSDEGNGLRFRTVYSREHGRKGAWRVLVADEKRLQYDCEPLHRDRRDLPRHLREKLTGGKIRPSYVASTGLPDTGEGDDTGEPTGPPTDSLESGSPCNPIKGRVSYGNSAVKINTAEAGSSDERQPWKHRWRAKPITPEGETRLRRKAAAIVRRLESLWWDNCKVAGPRDDAEARRGLAGFVFSALREGHAEAAIRRAVDLALHRLHMTATDRGERFTVASSITRARDILARDLRGERERVITFYDDRRRDLEETRAAMRSGMLLRPNAIILH